MTVLCAAVPAIILALTPYVLFSQLYQIGSPASQPSGRRTSTIGTELAVDPSLDPVLMELERGDFKAARRALDTTVRRQRSIERPIAELVVYLVTFDGHRAAGVLEELQRSDPLSAQRCRQARLSTTIASLEHKVAPLQKEIVGDALTRLAMAFP